MVGQSKEGVFHKLFALLSMASSAPVCPRLHVEALVLTSMGVGNMSCSLLWIQHQA